MVNVRFIGAYVCFAFLARLFYMLKQKVKEVSRHNDKKIPKEVKGAQSPED